MKYYSAIRKVETLPVAITWIGLETMILSKINQIENVVNHDYIHIWDIKMKATNDQRCFKMLLYLLIFLSSVSKQVSESSEINCVVKIIKFATF